MPQGIYKRTKAMCEAIRLARLGTKASPEACKNMSKAARKRASKLSWRENVSQKTKLAMKRPSIRRKHLLGLKRAWKKHGFNFKGGNGQRPVKFVLEMWKIFKPLGYKREHPIGLKNVANRNYKVDFALIDKKIAIECDGPKHRPHGQKLLDAKKDSILHQHGWKVIRIPHD